MNAYLVVAVCNFDDIPVGLYATETQAVAAAKKVKKPRKNPLLSWDITSFLGVKVLQFVKGKPKKLVFSTMGEIKDAA